MLCLVSSLFTPTVALLEVRPADAVLGLCQSLEKALSSGGEGLSVIQRYPSAPVNINLSVLMIDALVALQWRMSMFINPRWKALLSQA